MKDKIDFSLYLITDRKIAVNKSLVDIVKQAILAGATIIQLRDKQVSIREMIKLGRILRYITKKTNTPFIVNDRLDVALALNADGVHLGQDDMPVYMARKILGVNKIIGASARTMKEAKQAEKQGASYLGVGDIFGTGSKKDAGKPIGLGQLSKIVGSVSIPCVGIGGVNTDNAASVVKAGASGIAVISAIVGAPDPRKATRKLRLAIETKL